MKNYYKILQVDPDASSEVITNAYRALVKKYHPDVYYAHRTKELVDDKMQELNEAYSTLSQAETRSAYDARLKDYQEKLPLMESRLSRKRKFNNTLYWFLLVLFFYLIFRTVGQVILMSPVGKILFVILFVYLMIQWVKFRRQKKHE